MKKLLAVLLALCVIAGFASAQITFSGYDKAKATYASDVVTYANDLWLSAAATSDDKNFALRAQFDISSTGATPFTVSYAYGYAKFFDGMFKLTAGKLYNFDYYLGSNLSNNQTGNVSNGNLMFGYKQNAILFQIYPVEGLSIAVLNKPTANYVDIDDWKFDVSYDLANIGTFVAYFNPANDLAASAAGFGFNLSAVENLTAQVGYIGLASHTIWGIFGYTAGDLYAEVSGQYTIDASYYAEAGVEYTLANGMALRAFGGYDGDQSVLGADYIVGGELNIPMGKGEINLGVNYTADTLSVPVYAKFVF